MSDDGWYGGESQQPGTDGDPYGRGRRAGTRQGSSEQYASDYSQQQYTQDPYAQGYAAQPGQDYYQSPESQGGGQGWNSTQSGYSSAGYAQTDYGQSGYSQADYGSSDYSRSEYPQSGYSQSGYSGSGSGYTQPQPQPQPQSQQGPDEYGRRRRAPRSAAQQPQAPQAYSDPYASGSYGSDPYSSGSQASDPYASGSPSGSYARPQQQPQPPRQGRPADSGEYGTTRRDGYSTGSYNTSGTQAPGETQDPYRRRDTGSFERPVPGAQGPSGSRGRGRPAPPAGEYSASESSARLRRPGSSTYDDELESLTGSRTEAPGRSSRRGASAGRDEHDGDDDRFSLIGDDEDGDGEGRRGGKKLKQKKGRNCLAVFIAFSVLAGGLGYGGYSAYKWYQSKYGAPPDYTSSTGTGTSVDVTIPTGSGGTTIGGILFNSGIVESQRAFTDACKSNTNCANIEAGTYLLPKGISAAAAITHLLDPKTKDSKSQLITYGGERAQQVFASLEQKTGWKDSDILNVIATGAIDLPTWDTAKPGAKFPYARIEGFIASETYTLTDFANNPTALLKKMVDDQLGIFSQENLQAKAQAAGQSEYNMLIIASLARAEAGSNTSDLNKIAGVVFNRLKSTSFAHLGFDTATLYGMGNATTTPNNKDTTNPYNTSVFGIKGLPPGPIDNPDQTSIDAALNPAASTFLFFCATPDGVQYATTAPQWQQLGTKYPGLCGNG